jgi:hypothetical protein
MRNIVKAYKFEKESYEVACVGSFARLLVEATTAWNELQIVFKCANYFYDCH